MLVDPLPAIIPRSRPHPDDEILILGFLPDGFVVFVDGSGLLQIANDETVYTDYRFDESQGTWDRLGPLMSPEASDAAETLASDET